MATKGNLKAMLLAVRLDADRPPKPELSSADQDSHLVEMSLRGWPMTSAAKFPGQQRPELQHPSPNRFIGHIQPALGRQILNIAEAEGEARVQPHRRPDDVRRDWWRAPRRSWSLAIIAAIRNPPRFPCQFPQAVCATTDRKRRIASPKNSPPISATSMNSGHTTSMPAPR
jgi:hypothetical protein